MIYTKLSKYFFALKYFLLQNKREIISLKILPSEIVSRGVLSPFHYSQRKQKLNDILFLPPPNSLDVSLNRLRYATDDFCKRQAKKLRISDSSYHGIATITVQDIYTISINYNDIETEVCATPINDNGEYINIVKNKVYADTEGNPSHADLKYTIMIPIEPYKPQTQLRQIASGIVKLAIYHPDLFPESENWNGQPLPRI